MTTTVPYQSTPLAVDLDGTLVLTDTLHESLIGMVKSRPLLILLFPLWLLRGKAWLKDKVASIVSVNPSALPYNQPLLDWLRNQKSRGRRLVLCTASSDSIARSVSEYLGLFDSVIASDGIVNLKGHRKGEALKAQFGDRGFSYVGDANVDLEVWRYAQSAVVVTSDKGLISKVEALCSIEQRFPRNVNRFVHLVKLMRVHQWAKNLLIFVPAVAAHQIDVTNCLTLLIAFFAFSLCSSSVYIINDLVDLNSDRLHPRKNLRALASGAVSISVGIAVVPILIAAGVTLGSLVGPNYLLVLGCYFVLTLVYSLHLKSLVLIDSLILAVLYTLRIVAGAAAIATSVSFWLLTFSVFLFLSLAFVKRVIELREWSASSNEPIPGRGYRAADLVFVQNIGTSAGMVSVLVLALYIDSAAVDLLYKTTEFVWAAVAVFLFWICRIWLKAARGEMHDDPVVFAITDKTSLACGALFLTSMFAGSLGSAQ